MYMSMYIYNVSLQDLVFFWYAVKDYVDHTAHRDVVEHSLTIWRLVCLLVDFGRSKHHVYPMQQAQLFPQHVVIIIR